MTTTTTLQGDDDDDFINDDSDLDADDGEGGRTDRVLTVC